MSPEAIREMESALRRYEQEVEAARLRPSTVSTYLLHANNFVRWAKGEFVPGGTITKR
jgi:hypothetical protein